MLLYKITFKKPAEKRTTVFAIVNEEDEIKQLLIMNGTLTQTDILKFNKACFIISKELIGLNEEKIDPALINKL